MGKKLLVAAALALLTACDGSSRAVLPTGPSPVSAQVVFSVASSSPQASTAPECAGQIRLHPSFWGFAQVNMAPTESNSWGILFDEVPIGHHSVRVGAPPACGELRVDANGVTLADREPGALELGFRFVVHADGSVSP